MSQTSPFESVVDEAERAATAGDYATAERLLREALIIQEARLGPDHPDLANTLNNLGVVCEHTNNFVDAERSYRRAFAIATTSLAPDHPYVLTSRQNLTDFCAARGMPVALAVPKAVPETATRPAELEFLSERNRPGKTSPSAPAPVVADTEQAPETVEVEPPPPATRPAAVPAASVAPRRAASDAATLPTAEPPPASGGSRRLVASVLIVLAIAVVAIVATRLGGTTESLRSSPDPAPPPAAAPPAVSSTPPPAAPAPAVSDPPLTPSASETPKAPAAPPTESATAAAAAGLQIVDPRLCRTLSAGRGEWTCTRPGDPVTPGPLSFYTRVKSKTDTVVQVRWYQGSTLRQSGELRILPNTGAGYRTFSRRTIDRGGTGEWRVEVRTRDGELLHEERFVVR